MAEKEIPSINADFIVDAKKDAELLKYAEKVFKTPGLLSQANIAELSPENPYAYYSLALAYELKDMPNKALEYYYLYLGIETDDKMLRVVNQKIKELEDSTKKD